MSAAVYRVGGASSATAPQTACWTPLAALASNGFETEDTSLVRHQKTFALHIFAGVIVIDSLALMGWRSTVPIAIAAALIFLGVLAAYVGYVVSKDHASLRIAIVLSGLFYALLHYFAQGCQPVGISSGHIWVLVLPTLLFNVSLGGGVLLPGAAGCIHLIGFIIAAIVESTAKRCFDPTLDTVTSPYGLVFVNIILPAALMITCSLVESYAARTRQGQTENSERFARTALQFLTSANYQELAAQCLKFDQANPSALTATDEAILVAADHIASLRELIPGHIQGTTYTPVQPIQRVNSVVLSPPVVRLDQGGQEGPVAGTSSNASRVSGGPPEATSSLANSDDEKEMGEIQPFTSSNKEEPIDPHVPPITASPRLAEPQRSPARTPSSDGGLLPPTDGAQARRRSRREGGEVALSGSHQSQSRNSVDIRRRSSLPNITLSLPMTYEPAFIVVFTLPYMTNYVTRSIKNLELLKMVFTEFADNVRKAAVAYHGVSLWSNFSSIYCKFPDINSATCGSLMLLELMKRDGKHHRDQYLLETKANLPFVVILHAHLLAGVVGSEAASLATLGCSPADKVITQIIETPVVQTIDPPAVVAPVLLKSALIDQFLLSDSAHPALILIDAAKQVNGEGFPICSTSPPFVDIEKTEVQDLEAIARELASTLLANGLGQHDPSRQANNANNKMEGGMKRRRLPTEVLEIWNRFDTDRSGTLDVDEIREVLLEMGMIMGDEELKMFFHTVDADHSGSVSQEEFTKSFFSATLGGCNVMSNIRRAAVAMGRNTGADNLPIVLNAWKKYDTDGSGCLEPKEVFQLLQDLHMSTTQEEAEWLVNYMDKNGNGTIEFDEFAALFSEDDATSIRVNQVKERIQTVTRVITNKSSGKSYSNEEQQTRDKLIHLDDIINTYFVAPLFLYIVYNFGTNLFGTAMGHDHDETLNKIIADIVLDFAVYGSWIALKLGFLPKEVNGQIIWKRGDVLRNAVRTLEFWVDLIVIFPADFIYLGLGGLNDRSNGVISYYRMNKVLALYYFDDLFQLLTRALDPSIGRVLNALCYFWIFSHIAACHIIITAREIGEDKFYDMLNTVRLISDDETTYIKAFYSAILTLSGQLVGPTLPNYDEQLRLLLISVFMGLPIFTVVIGTIGNAIAVEDSEERFLAKLDTLRSYFSYTKMAQKMEDECVAYYRHVFNTTGSLDITDNPLEDLPVELSVPVTVEIGREMLKKVPIFAQACENLEFVHELTSKLVPKVLEPGIIIMKKGDRGTNMYFLTYGECEVLTDPGPTGIAVFTFKKGAFFGEIALLHNIKRTATIGVGKKRYANVLTLDKKEFDEVAETFPQSFSQVYKAAEERIKQVLEKEAEEARIAKEKRKQERKEEKRRQRAAAGQTAQEDESDDEDDEPAAAPQSITSLAKSLTASRPMSQQASRRPMIERQESVKFPTPGEAK